MKKIASIFVGLVMVFLCATCISAKGSSEDKVSETRSVSAFHSTGFKCARHKGQDQENLPSSVAKINVGVRKDLFLVEILEEATNGDEKKYINSTGG